MTPHLTTSLKLLLETKAQFYQQIRDFFAARQVLEVTTPILELEPNPSPGLEPVVSGKYFLPSSPEFAMKRLLALGSGDIFQITKAFRGGEMGRWHRVEFAILEWYRLGFSLDKLLEELLDLLAALGFSDAVQTRRVFSYTALFKEYLGLDPNSASLSELRLAALQHQVTTVPLLDERASWIEMLFTLIVEPHLTKGMVIVKDFPKELAMLAAVATDPVNGMATAQRFELYLNGVELANAFEELTDASEQRQRFKEDITTRQKLGFIKVPMPERFLAALTNLPPCAGIAVGLERLFALKCQASSLVETLPIDDQNE